MTIALIEQFWHGHHPIYFKAFSRMLLDLGHDVLAVCPSPEEVVSAQNSEPSTESRAAGHLYSIKYSPSHINVRPRRFQGRVDTFLSHRWLKKTLLSWEAANRRKISLVFFACIYDETFQYFPATAKGFPWPWSGLYLHVRSFRMPGSPYPYTGLIPRPERNFRNPNLQSIATMDERAVEYLGSIARGRPITVFPDFTDETPPAPGGIAEELRRFAAGRPIVGLVGHLQPTKGVTTLARVALDPTCSDIVFAFVGDLMAGHFPPEDLELFDSLRKVPNVFAHFQGVPDDASFNAVVEACDVLFAAYHDFPHSSNILSKSAIFRKPIVVSDGYLMAERVRRYALGEVVPQENPVLAAAALRTILTDKPRWLDTHRPQWDKYCALNSRESAKRAFDQLLTGKGSIPVGTPSPNRVNAP